MSMREIALACGFSSLPLFSRSFRAKYGKAPSESKLGQSTKRAPS
jgi:transcriptional regulator GlxA family with amidase domain